MRGNRSEQAQEDREPFPGDVIARRGQALERVQYLHRRGGDGIELVAAHVVVRLLQDRMDLEPRRAPQVRSRRRPAALLELDAVVPQSTQEARSALHTAVGP